MCPGGLFRLPQGKKVNRGHRNVSAKCTGPKLTDSIPSLRLYKECVSRTQEEAIRLTSPAIARRARRQPGELVSSASPAAAGRARSLERARRSRASSVPSPAALRAADLQKQMRTETLMKQSWAKLKLGKTLAIKRSAGMREAHLGFQLAS